MADSGNGSSHINHSLNAPARAIIDFESFTLTFETGKKRYSLLFGTRSRGEIGEAKYADDRRFVLLALALISHLQKRKPPADCWIEVQELWENGGIIIDKRKNRKYETLENFARGIYEIFRERIRDPEHEYCPYEVLDNPTDDDFKTIRILVNAFIGRDIRKKDSFKDSSSSPMRSIYRLNFLPNLIGLSTLPPQEQNIFYESLHKEIIGTSSIVAVGATAKILPTTGIPAKDPHIDTPHQISHPQAFKKLSRYESSDKNFFFGRDSEKKQFLAIYEKYPLLILTGDSGIGKSSFIRAAILPEVAQSQDIVLTLDLGNSPPLQAIRQQIIDAISSRTPGETLIWNSETKYLHTFLTSNAQVRNINTILFLDQFERIAKNEEECTLFLDELVRCIFDRTLHLKVILSVRNENFSSILQYLEHKHGLVYNETISYMVLNGLSLSSAKDVIVKSFMAIDINVSESLQNRIIETIARPRRYTFEKEIFPPLLQFVCDKLLSERALPKSKATGGTISLELNDFVDTPDSFEKFLREHIGETLLELGGARAEVAQLILKILASLEGTVDPSSDLDIMIPSIRDKARASDEMVHEAIDKLVARALIKRTQLGGIYQYELVHDCIASIVVGLMNEQELQEKMARQILTASRNKWLREEKGIDRLLDVAIFDQIAQYLDPRGFSGEDWEYLVKSTVRYSCFKSLYSYIKDARISLTQVMAWMRDLYKEADSLEDDATTERVAKAVAIIDNEEATTFLIDALLSTRSNLTLISALDSLIYLRGKGGLEALITKADALGKEGLIYKIFAYLIEEKRDSGHKDMESLVREKVRFLEALGRLSVWAEIWKLRLRKIKENRSVIGHYARYGMFYGAFSALIGGMVCAWIGAGFWYKLHILESGEIGAKLKTIIESPYAGFVLGTGVFTVAYFNDLIGSAKSLRLRLGYATAGSLAAGIAGGIFMVPILFVAIYGENREPFNVTFRLSIAYLADTIFGAWGVLVGLALSIKRDGTRDTTFAFISCLITVIISVLMFGGLISSLQDIFFLEGVREYELSDGSRRSYLSYKGINLTSELTRAFILTIGVSMSYIYIRSKKMLSK